MCGKQIYQRRTNESHAQDEQKIAEQTTEKGTLNEVKVTSAQSNPGDDKLDDVPQSCVQQSTDGLAGPQRDLFSSETQKCGKGNDGKGGDDEDDRVGLMSPV